ncbi:Uncharacterized protein family (UPF0158) [Bernardetia litoralis DSM 6794]|uniref:Uncharacterized protein family (UPF0158) n=1 Tax=Bernardetia litoralis (strain ATCC 23117 / DSM 6794 / NBRC 15988 / NCIMB 1366 / Fx l1 / Sio-4) TaxID=880071 RepID=I4ALQ2_BERLS|nr:UPF0158 family protein [Bernardetia litoralis]AFM04887.1 Uncharacterized protein family (UPF0158) [Bernardetia litoralis DSM 6794]
MNIPQSIIKEVADEINAFGNCYINKTTLEIIAFPKDEYERKEFLSIIINAVDEDEEQQKYKDIEQNPQNYYLIEKPSSSDGYKLMEKFASQISDERIRERLEQALDGKSPFANFKHIVKQEIPKKWYAFEEVELIKYVENELKRQTE